MDVHVEFEETIISLQIIIIVSNKFKCWFYVCCRWLLQTSLPKSKSQVM